MNSVDFMQVKNTLKWDTYRKILIPVMQLLNSKWRYPSINDVVKLAITFN